MKRVQSEMSVVSTEDDSDDNDPDETWTPPSGRFLPHSMYTVFKISTYHRFKSEIYNIDQ